MSPRAFSTPIRRVAEAITPILDTVSAVRARLDDRTALIGFAGAPFTVACYMVEGGGSKDFAAVRRMAYDEPGLFGWLMSVLTDQPKGAQTIAGNAGALEVEVRRNEVWLVIGGPDAAVGLDDLLDAVAGALPSN